MEKLIKLINEHQKEKHPDGIYLPVVAYRDWIFWSDSDCLSSVIDEIHLVSKNYWFIKRLIENDKIDRDRERKMIKQVWTWWTLDLMNFDRIQDVEYYSFEETLLMLLSISSSPIEDLISYLK